jgi:hypothetical protein
VTPARSIAGPSRSQAMKVLTLKFTTKELELLTGLASDQLFRREFIDPKMPGYRPDSGQIRMAKVLVTRLKTVLDPSIARRMAPAGIAG